MESEPVAGQVRIDRRSKVLINNRRRGEFKGFNKSKVGLMAPGREHRRKGSGEKKEIAAKSKGTIRQTDH